MVYWLCVVLVFGRMCVFLEEQMDKEFVDRVEGLAQEYAEVQVFGLPALSIQGFISHLRSQVEYPCPLCGEEMRVVHTLTTVYAECERAVCPLAITRSYSSERELKEAL